MEISALLFIIRFSGSPREEPYEAVGSRTVRKPSPCSDAVA